MSDATVLIRDIAADASQKAANQVRPSQEQLAQIDEPAEENTWHEKPNLNKEDLKKRIKEKTVSLPHMSRCRPRSFVIKDRRSSAAGSSEQGDDSSVTPSEMSRRKKYANQTKEYLQEKVPKERRDQTIWRLKKMVIEIQGHADCQYSPM